jgi:molybdopterin molybdotransferase
MISVPEAQQTIDRNTAPLRTEQVPLAAVLGRVLSEPVASAEDIPAFDRSAMDGYAVRADDVAKEFEVVGEIRAGQTEDRTLKPGQAVRIFTGAQLPCEGLKVVMQEHVEVSGNRIRVVKESSHDNVRKRGEDARRGEVLLQPGAVLDATAVSLLASMGKTLVSVTRQPRILHLTTGDEIVSPDQTPGPGQIRNSNASLIAGLCREQGIEDIEHYHTKDDISSMKELLRHAMVERYDLILISGGSGHGDYDFSAELFRHLGATIHFREINVRPGKPLIFGTVPIGVRHPGTAGLKCLDEEPLKGLFLPQIIFGLPGNALSHFVCFHLFVRRALDRLMSRAPFEPLQAFLAEDMKDTANARETWWPAQAALKEGRLQCRALPWKSSGDITRLPSANALIKVPSATPHFPAGTKVDILLTGALGCSGGL